MFKGGELNDLTGLLFPYARGEVEFSTTHLNGKFLGAPIMFLDFQGSEYKDL